MGLNLGFGSQTQKSTQTTKIDPLLRGMQEANYGAAQTMPGYKATSADQIQGYMNPYISNVLDRFQSNANIGARNVMNLVSDRANAAKAFGGSRHGVAEGVALGEFGSGMMDQIAQLLAGGYQQALGAAQGENQFGYNALLNRQGMLNQTLAGITPETTTTGKTKSTGFDLGFKYGKG